VFVLTDDLTDDLGRFMPRVRSMEQRGTTFTDFTVTDSQCCPSRSSTLTGKYPHNTGILGNSPPWGGYGAFRARGEEHRTFAVALHDAGYRTAFMGKYLNGYRPGAESRAASPVPPGWDEWDGVGFGYRGYDYDIAHNGTTTSHGHRRGDYLTTVLEHRATRFIGAAAASGQPFLLEMATFTPHSPSIPAPADAHAFPHLTAPRTAAFDVLPNHPPAWLAGRPPLKPAALRNIDRRYRRRAQDALSIDRLLGAIERTLAGTGAAGDTVVVFSSDNGYHLGEHRLGPGKMTAFDTDVQVPLVVTGPHVPPGSTSAAVVQNVDLAPTFEVLAGLPPDPEMDGRSLVELLHGGATSWTAAALVEHHGPDTDVEDPDYPGPGGTNPPSFTALRTASYTYVEYAAGGAELYDRRSDPAENRNVVGSLSPDRRAELHHALVRLGHCRGAAECTAARGAVP
jgi:arylsulfatase A-like enzyme